MEHDLCAPQLCYGALLFCIGAFPLSKPLPLGEVSPKVTERARPLTEKLLYSDTLTLTKRQLIAAQRLFYIGLALSGAHAPALPKGEPFGRGKAANSLQRVHISIHNNRKGVPHEREKAACLHLYFMNWRVGCQWGGSIRNSPQRFHNGCSSC